MGKFWLKMIINGIIVIPLLYWFTEASFAASLITAAVLCLVAYALGDQIVLRMTNNTVATIADAVLAFLFLWAVASVMKWSLSFWELIVIVAILGVAEFIFHSIIAGDRKRSAGY